MKYIIFFFILSGCMSGREFWTYAIDEKVDKPLAERPKGEVDQTGVSSEHTMKVVYSDGSARTEVQIPILTSGQRVIVEHQSQQAKSGTAVMTPAPVDADKSIEDTYLRQGQPVNEKADAVSIVRTQERIRHLVREGNYNLALEYAEKILARYPNHAETLKTKGGLLLKIGEREAALEAYERSYELAPDPRVKTVINQLEKEIGG